MSKRSKIIVNLARNNKRPFPVTDQNDTCELAEKSIRSQYQFHPIVEPDQNNIIEPSKTDIHGDYVRENSNKNLGPISEDNDSRISSDLDENQIQVINQMENMFGEDILECQEDESVFDNDFSDEDPTYTPPKPPKPYLNLDSDSDSILAEDEVIEISQNSFLECYQNETEIKVVEKETKIEPVEMWITLLLDKILDDVWNSVQKPKRWKKSNPSEWKINIAKKRRAEGSAYMVKNKLRAAKIRRPVDCGKCKFKCTEKISEENRNQLCRYYWNLDFSAKKNFLLNNITVKPIRTRLVQRASEKNARQFSKKCFFSQGNEKIQVCQTFFTATLCICVDVILDAISKRDSVGCYSSEDKRGKREPINKTKAEDVQFVKRHIESFPVMQSHYTRKDTLRKYLESTLNIKKMYLLYIEKCKEYNKKPVSENKYRRIFGEDYNLSFFTPKKDQCLICVNFAKGDSEKKRSLKESYEEHRKRNQVCQEAKKLDKQKANEDRTFMSVTMDLQAVLQIPKGAVGQLYYVRKLVVYNLTIFESPLPNNAYCLCWNETNGKKGSCEIGTCLYYYLSNCLRSEVNHITIFSDTCGGQNRNQFIAALLLWAVHKIDHLKVIEQKFLESGHTYMEADSMHSAIESASKNVDITSMSDWKNIFRKARRPKVKTIDNTKYIIEPYKVKEIKYGEVLDLKKLAQKIIKNKATDTDGNLVKWMKIKRLKYVKGEKDSIFFNYDLLEEFKCLKISSSTKTPQTRSRRLEVMPPLSNEELPNSLEKLYKHGLPISEKKKRDLIKMCKEDIFPEELHGWINNLKTIENLSDCVPDIAVEDKSDDEDEAL